MNVLEKILEDIEERVNFRKKLVRYEKKNGTIPDVARNRGALEELVVVEKIIRSHMVEKEKVSSAEIISRNIDGSPYYEIKFKKVGEDDYTVGYSSYKLDYVVDWLNECFEFCGELKVVVNDAKDINVPSNNGWIPVSERLPEEKGWYQCTCSGKEIWNDDIVRDLYYYPGIKEFVDNIRYETNGLKNIEKFFWTKYVTAWQQQPKPYKVKEKS